MNGALRRSASRAGSHLLPDLLVVAVVAMGRIGYEPRLALDAHVSLNQLLLVPFHVQVAVLALRSRRLPLGATLVLAGLLLGYLGLSWCWSPARDYGLEKILHLALITLPALVWFHYRCLSAAGRWSLVASLFLLGAGMALAGGLLLARGMNDLSGRISVLGGGPIVFSRWVGSSLLVGAVFLATHFRTLPRLARWAGAGLLAALLMVLLAAGSKGPVLGLLAAAGTLGWIYGGPRRGRLLLGLLAVGGLALAIVLSLGDQYAVRYFMNPFDTIAGGSYGVRMHYLARAWDLFLSGLPCGHGVGAWSVLVSHFDRKDYPHNLFAELGVEGGVVALGAVWLLLGHAVLPQALRLSRSRDWVAMLALGLGIMWIVNVQFSGDLHDNRLLVIICGLFSGWRLRAGGGLPPRETAVSR